MDRVETGFHRLWFWIGRVCCIITGNPQWAANMVSKMAVIVTAMPWWLSLLESSSGDAAEAAVDDMAVLCFDWILRFRRRRGVLHRVLWRSVVDDDVVRRH